MSFTEIPEISILLAVKDGFPYLPQTITSLQQQTLQNWEAIVIDDASTDETQAYLQTVASNDNRFKVFRNSENLGHSESLNRGLQYCQSPWIARIDADDIALPNRLEKQLNFITQNPDVKVTSCLAYYITPEGKRIGKTHHNLTTRQIFNSYMETQEAIGLLHPGALIHRETLLQAGGYRKAFEPANDIDLWNRISEQDNLILIQPEYLMEYRVHNSSMVGQSVLRARMKHEWVRACMRARRSSQIEPDWEAFLQQWQQTPWPKRLNRWRKTQAKVHYRQAAMAMLFGKPVSAVTEMGLAMLLQPSYTFPRLKQQLLKTS